MDDRDRLEQLRGLLARLDRMPASAERDWMLREVRARAVDVETGATPAAMRALSRDGAEPVIPAAPQASRIGAVKLVPPLKPRRTPASRRPAARAASGAPCAVLATPVPRSLAAARQPEAQESVVDLLEQGGVLCLDDQLAVGAGADRPWSTGLRG